MDVDNTITFAEEDVEIEVVCVNWTPKGLCFFLNILFEIAMWANQ